MIQYVILCCLCLFSIAPTQADSVATIGERTVVINRSTSCDAKNWGSNQASTQALNQVYACGCCITKQNVISKASPDKKGSSDEIVRQCIKGKYCTLNTLAQWAPGETKADDMVTQVLWSTIDTPKVTVDPTFLDKSGKLRPERVADFLGSLRKDLRDLREPLYTDFSRPKCLEAKNLGSGGANTAQLFLIKANDQCITGNPKAGALTPKYILKETKKKTEEIRNIRQLHQSDLKKIYDLSLPKRDKDKLAISFDALNIKYGFKGSNHYLSILIIAPGKSLMNLTKDLGAAIKKGDTTEEHAKSDILYKSFEALGKGLGELHLHFMDKNSNNILLGNSIIHGDLHMDNVYADPTRNYLITLIDNESFAQSLQQKRPVGVDLFVLYAFTVAQFKDQYRYPKEISLTKWNNIMLKPFILGYISNWPKNQRPQLLRELKKIYTDRSTFVKLLPQRFLFINLMTYRSYIKDITRVFDDISKIP